MKVSSKAVGVSAIFWAVWIMVYPVCNWITSFRADVHAFYFEWEHRLPFVPVLIIPYLSIDIFLALIPFLIKNTDELRIYGRRMVTATLVAGVCYLAFPLSFGWPRPPVEGFLGQIIKIFRSMDLPFNQCPSLHVAYLMVMFGPFMRNTRGMLRVGIAVWFLLILVSTLFTYQHHCVDVLGGMALGALCIGVFRLQANSRTQRRQTGGQTRFEMPISRAAEADALRQ